MRLLLFVLVLAGATVCVGFYEGWFHFGSDNTLSVNKEKFQEDEKKAAANVQDVERKIKDKFAGPSATSTDGTVTIVSAENLTMTNKEGKVHTHALTAGIKVTCDGKVCKAADLKPGMRVRVTTENAEPHAAIRIEALDYNRDSEKGA